MAAIAVDKMAGDIQIDADFRCQYKGTTITHIGIFVTPSKKEKQKKTGLPIESDKSQWKFRSRKQ